MNPIVNGIQQEANGRYDVIKLNALAEGKDAFAYYKLLGHPSYIVFKANSERAWSHIGLQTREDLLAQLDSAAK